MPDWDVGSLSAPVKIGGGPVDGLPRGGTFASGNYVYIVTVVDGVRIFDVSTPSSPVNTGNCTLDPSNLAWNSAKSGNLIFAALSDGGMKIVDVSDPHNPVVTGTYSDVVYGVGVTNGRVYVVSYNCGLNILDVSNPSNITVTGSCSVPGFPYRVRVQGNYALIGNTDSGTGGINVVNVSDPANPALLGQYNAPDMTNDLEVLPLRGIMSAPAVLPRVLMSMATTSFVLCCSEERKRSFSFHGDGF